MFNFLAIGSPHHKTIWALALPIMLSNISVPLLGLVDTAILGHLSDSRYLAAVAMGASLFTFVFWSFAFLRMGTTALVAQNFQNTARLINIIQSALLLALSIGVILFLLAPFIGLGLINLVGAVQHIEPLALEYLLIRFDMAPAVLMNYALLGYFIGMGKTHIPLILLVSCNLVNGLLNYIFVYHFNMNSAGVAYASNIAEGLQLLLGVLFLLNNLPLFSQSPLKGLNTHLAHFFNINGQLFIRTLFLLFTFAFFMKQGAMHSDVMLAANAILINLLMFMSNALDGFAIASESMVGKAVALKQHKAIKQIIKISGLWSFLCALLFSLLLLLFHDSILQLLTSQSEVLDLLSSLSIWLILLPLAGFASYWLDGIYIGLAQVRQMRNSILFSVFVLFLPLHYLLQNWTYHGLWLAFFAFLLGRAAWQLWVLAPSLEESANKVSQ